MGYIYHYRIINFLNIAKKDRREEEGVLLRAEARSRAKAGSAAGGSGGRSRPANLMNEEKESLPSIITSSGSIRAKPSIAY